uniref:Complement component 1, s subcomponent.1 n=1 Tax=Astyanax mexicanus TaxID=7994 RepID=A0A3B1JD02_ASTMX
PLGGNDFFAPVDQTNIILVSFYSSIYIKMNWERCAPAGHTLTLSIVHLDLEDSHDCENDALEVGRVFANGILISKLCGKKSTEQLQASVNPSLRSPSGGCLSLTFQTDYSNTEQHTGFRAFYTVQAVDCGDPDLPDLLALTEEHPLTTYTHNISLKCLTKFYQLSGHGKYHAVCMYYVHFCGMNEEFFSFERVFGGERARLKQIPWQLLMKEPKRGGASLISDRWALTAAHVVDGLETKKLKFYGGMIDVQDINAVIMETEKIIIHPDYARKVSDKDRSTFDNDIALVKMSERVPLSFNIRPVCLPEKSAGPVMKEATGTVSGRFLQYAHLEENLKVPCFQSPMKVTDNMFCAGGDGADSCQGDSGGPLFLPMLGTGAPNKPYRLEGIVSWAPSDKCGDEEFKGYYTKVQNYLGWIRETMEKN